MYVCMYVCIVYYTPCTNIIQISLPPIHFRRPGIWNTLYFTLIKNPSYPSISICKHLSNINIKELTNVFPFQRFIDILYIIIIHFIVYIHLFIFYLFMILYHIHTLHIKYCVFFP